MSGWMPVPGPNIPKPQRTSGFKPMKKRIKKAWLKALRSGEYKQGQTCLRKLREGQDTMCCLGVLADVLCKRFPSIAGPLDMEWDQGRDGWSEVSINGTWSGGVTGQLPEQVLAAIGLEDEAQDYLILLNDSKNKSFQQIAQIVERKL